MFNSEEFKVHELFSDKNGKTSGSAFVGLLLGIVTAICFMAGTVGLFLKTPLIMEFIVNVLYLGALSASLMGLRKVVDIKRKDKEV